MRVASTFYDYDHKTVKCIRNPMFLTFTFGEHADKFMYIDEEGLEAMINAYYKLRMEEGYGKRTGSGGSKENPSGEGAGKVGASEASGVDSACEGRDLEKRISAT